MRSISGKISVPSAATTDKQLPMATLLLLASMYGATYVTTASAGVYASEEDFLEDIPVVLSVTRLSQPITHAPAAITIITQEMIEASGSRSLPDVFKMVPGFLVDYEMGNRPIVTYHGLSDSFARRIQVLVDGRSVYLPSYFGVRWSDLPLAIEDIDHIEVIRGPNTAAYGANAFLATISIHTRALPEKESTYVRALYGRYDERRFVARHEGKANKLSYRVNTSFEYDDLYGHINEGFANLGNNIYKADTLNERRNDFKRNISLTSKLGYRLATNDYLTLDLGILRGRRGEGDYSGASEIAEIYDTRVNTHYQQVKWERKLGVNNDVMVQFYHNHYSTLEQYTENGHDTDQLWNYDTNSNRYDLELQQRTALNDSTRVVWGINTRLDQIGSGTNYYDHNPVEFRLNRIYSNLEWYATPNLSTNLGLMLEHNNFIGPATSPRIALNYALSRNLSVRAATSRAIRVPSTLEESATRKKPCDIAGVCTSPDLYFEWIGNSDLKTEKITSRELGLHAIFSKATLDFKIYKDTIHDFVYYTGTVLPGNVYATVTFDNAKEILVSGFEMEADIRPTENDYIRIAYSDTDIDSEGDEDNYETSMPRRSISALVSHKFPHSVRSSIAYYYMNRYEPLDGNLIPEVRRADFTISRSFKSGGTSGKVSFVAQSILGNYISNSWDKLFQNTAYVSLELEY